MHKVLPIVLLWSVWLTQQAFSQTISGQVTSSEDNGVLPGVNVVVKGTSTGTITDAEGQYTITASAGNTLVFSYIGYTSKEIVVGEATAINVQLATDVTQLGEVVVTALGIKQEKRALGYSAQTIQGGELAETQRTNFGAALMGRVAGAMITPSSGAPGASVSIMLRGVSSLSGNNQPLFVVDGLPIDNRTFNQGALVSDGSNRDNDYLNRAADINPNDIESVTILKGPEASALYGIDAASGAIIITTKKGSQGKGKINYDNSFRLEEVYRFPEIQTEYGPGLNGITDNTRRIYLGARYGENEQLYDNRANFFQTGFLQRHNLGLEGGTDRATYRLSTSYTDQVGVIPNTAFKQLNVRLSSSAKIGNHLDATTSLNYINTTNAKPSKGQGGMLLGLLLWPSNDDIRNEFNADGTRRRLISADASDLDNPFFDAQRNKNTDRTNRMIGNIQLSYNPTKWLNLRALFGADVYATQGNFLLHPESNRGIAAGGIIENFVDNNRLFTTNLFATAKHDFGDLKTSLLLGSAIEDRSGEVNAIRGTRFYDPQFNSINNTDPITQRTKTTLSRRRLVGLFGALRFNYKDIVYLDITGRNDWSSTLPKQNNAFFYPSASVAFVFTELGPLQNSTVLPFGKLRFSFAQVGKDAPPYQVRPNLVPQLTTGGGYAYGVYGGNPNLKPEKTQSYEIGTELHFLNGRITVDAAYFDRSAFDQITAPRISYGTGFVLQYLNGASLRNYGFELLLSATPIKKVAFSWEASANFTRMDSKVLSIPADQREFYVFDTWLYAGVRASLYKGFPATTLGGFAYQRNNKGDILINPTSGLPLKTADFVQIGDRNPDFVMGLTNSFRYKNFSLSFLFDIRKGGDVFNGNELFLYVNGLSKRTLDRETPIVYKGVLKDGLENTDNPTINTIQITPATRSDFYISANGYVEEAFIEKNINWLRLRDVTLGYQFPQALLGRQKIIQSAGVFLTGTDVWMLTNYTGADPSVNGLNASVGGSGAAGFDYGVLSLPRALSFGIRLSL